MLGTRPELIKNYSIVKALRRRDCAHVVLHTNQHRDPRMHEAIAAELGYGPDVIMEEPYEIGRAISWVQEMIRRHSVDLVLVNGDTAAALVGAVAAVYADVGLAHVEAGLRSGDPEMHEERNRIMVDSAAHYLFAYTEAEARRLRETPDLRGRVYCVGNTTLDVLEDFAGELGPPPERDYLFITLHRKELTDRREELIRVLGTVNELAADFAHAIFPMHPRTRDVMSRYSIPFDILGRVTITEPMPALRALAYEKHAALILTDSGCIQEEACIFGVPCVTVRENTERTATVEVGANVVTGFRPESIRRAVDAQRRRPGPYPPIYGEPGVGDRIVDLILADFRDFRTF